MKAWIVAAGLAGLMIEPAAAAGIKLGKPGYGGTGCPAGTASVSVSGSSITLKFSSYRATAGSGKSFDREACGLSIPFTTPSGQAVAIVGMDFAGYNNLPAGTSSTFSVEQFLAGGQGPKFTKTFNGPAKGKFTTSSDVPLSWSGCGANATLRVQSSLLVKSANGKAASASIRSQDVGTTIVYRLKYKSC